MNVQEMNLMSYESVKNVIATLPREAQVCFKAFDVEATAREASDTATLDYVFYMHNEGIVADEMVDTYESKVKDLELWPYTVKDGERSFLGVVKAKKECLAAMIRERIYQLVKGYNGSPTIKDKDGMLQFHAFVDGKPFAVKNESNTTPEGSFTRGKARGGEESIKEKVKAGSRGAQLPNPANDDKAETAQVETADTIRHKSEKISVIETAFGHLNDHQMNIRRIIEAHRPALAKTVAGRAFLEEMAGHPEQLESNMGDLADALSMKQQNGKYTIKVMAV